MKDNFPLPGWVIHSSTSFGVDFFDKHGSTRRKVVYEWIDGRLFRSSITDRSYPDDQQFWRENQSTGKTAIMFKPDGTGLLENRVRATKERTVTELIGLDVSAHWLEVPAFGSWEALTDPGMSASEIAEQARAL